MSASAAQLPKPLSESSAQRQFMRHRVVRKIQENTHYLAMASMFCGLLGFPHYLLAVDNHVWLAQLFTYLIFVLISFTLLLENGHKNLAMLTISMVTVSLFVVQLTPYAAEFNDVAHYLRNANLPHQRVQIIQHEYVSAAVLACLIAMSYLMRRLQWVMFGQALLCVAILIPAIPVIGYLCGIGHPYGSMSVLATFSGLLCAAGLMAKQASHPPLSILLLMDGSGKRMRWSIFVLGIGALLLTRASLLFEKQAQMIPILVVVALVVIIYTLALTYYQTANRSQEQLLPPSDMDFASQVETALDHQQFYMVFQPQVDFVTGKLKGVEALIRWLHPTLGSIPPMEFIRVAELTGLIVPLGKWALAQACQQVIAWQKDPRLANIELSVNVSSLQLKSPQFVEDVLAILAETGVPAQRLVLEITESAFMQDDGANACIIGRLKAAGIKLAIDDFGTGYSCLAYLRNIPGDYLKIDRSFVMELPGHQKAEAVIEAIVNLGKSLQYKIIAEGVETPAQADFLRQQDCDIVQGFLYGKPMDADVFLVWMDEHYA